MNLDVVELGGFVGALLAAAIVYWRDKGETRGHRAILTAIGLASLGMLLSLRYQQLPRVERSLALSSRHVSEPAALELADEYVESSEILGRSTDPFFREYFEKQRAVYLEVLRDAQQGRYVIPKNEIGVFANRVIDAARTSVIATSYVNTPEWWDEPWGRQYEALNYDKIRQGVKITRYFLFSDQQEFEANRRMLLRQMQNGVDLYIVNPSDIADTYWNDIIIVDDRFGSELLLTPEKTIRRVVMYTENSDIERLAEMVEALRVRATPVSELLDSTGDQK